MTSEETTIGKYPKLVINTMAAILNNADKDGSCNPYDWSKIDGDENAWSRSVVELAHMNLASAIVIYTHSGTTAREISARRPDIPVIAVCKDEIIANQLCLHRGVFPILDNRLFREKDSRSAMEAVGIKPGRAVEVDGDGVTLRRFNGS
jgi:pyruvate kinase